MSTEPYALDPNDPRAPTEEQWSAMTRDALNEYFRRKGRRVYVSSELVTYHPGQRRFCPDVLAVLDTYVATLEAHIVRFATVAASSIERASLRSARLRERLFVAIDTIASAFDG